MPSRNDKSESMHRDRKKIGLLEGKEGVDFVRCRLCSERRLILTKTGHLFKHRIDRATYMAKYGLTADQLTANVFRLHSTRCKGYVTYDRSNWEQALRTIYRKTKTLSTRYLQRYHPRIYANGCRIYGDWSVALRAANFDPAKYYRQFRLTEIDIINRVRDAHDKHLPLYPRYVLNHNAKLFFAACRRYGTWRKAIIKSQILKNLRATPLYRRHSSLLNALNHRLNHKPETPLPRYFRDEIEYYFGSLEKALAELRKRRKVVLHRKNVEVRQ